MPTQKKAMQNWMKAKVITDFLDQMGVRVVDAGDSYVSIWDELVGAMYTVMDVKILDKDELGQMLNLWLAGLNPSAYWSQGASRGGERADRAQQFLGAFTDRAANTWNQLWQGDQDTDKEQIGAILKTFRRMKTTLKQRAKDEARSEISRTRDTVSIGGGGETEQEQAYESQMEGEITRSVSVGQTFNLSSWDEISAAGRRDEKVGAAVDRITALFSDNGKALARAVVDIAFGGARNADPFEYKFFQIVMGVGDFETTVSTQFGDITLNEKVLIARPPKIKRKDWKSAFVDYMAVITFPELRNLMVLPKDMPLPENLEDLARARGVTRPLANAIITLPSELMIAKSDILGNADAVAVIGKHDPSVRTSPIKRQGRLLAVTDKAYADLRDKAVRNLNQKWDKGKKGRAASYWKAGMLPIIREIMIDPDIAITDWIVADPLPSSVSPATKKFVDDFQSDLLRILIDLDEAHGWYELRNKRFAKKKEAKTHRLASKVAYRWLVAQTKVGNLRNLRMKLMKDFLKLIRGKSQDSVYRAAQAVEKAFDLRVTPTDKWDVLDVMVDELTEWLMSPEAQDEPVDYHLDFAKEVFKSALR